MPFAILVPTSRRFSAVASSVFRNVAAIIAKPQRKSPPSRLDAGGMRSVVRDKGPTPAGPRLERGLAGPRPAPRAFGNRPVLGCSQPRPCQTVSVTGTRSRVL